MTSILELKNVSKHYQDFSLKNINFSLEKGYIMGFIGPNGAGKSTTIKLIMNLIKKDEGNISIFGLDNEKHNIEIKQRIGFVYDENHFYEELTPNEMKGIIRPFYKKWDEAVFQRYAKDFQLPLNKQIKNLSKGMKMKFSLAVALSHHAEFLIMDEPTSSLTEKEVNHLFTIIRKLKDRGCGIVYISHKMEEIFQLCDEITILRDGQWIATQPLEGLDMDKIIAMMVGRSLNQRFPDKQNVPGETILEVRNLTSLRQPSIRDVSFDLRKGEILGIAGLVGAKRTDIVETLFGIREKAEGTITLHGKKINNHNANEAINNGFALVTEERRSTGIYAYLDINFNSLISNIRNYKNKVGLLDNSRMKSDTQWVIDSMRVKTPGHRTQIGSLSGGNQQKVIIGRWLLTQPEILMLDEPTRGIDVGAKFEIYQLIAELAKKDKGIIIISSEMPELLGITDRILVMSNGLVAGIVETKTTTQNEILRLASLHL